MTRLAWLTDIHLDFLTNGERGAFVRMLAATDADGFLLGGDIGHAPSLREYLREIEGAVQRPVYFVLGNHDFYGGSIAEVSAATARVAAESPHLQWLNTAGVVRLGRNTALIGHGGWGDARLGNFSTTPVQLNDFVYIAELAGLSRPNRIEALNALGDEAAGFLGTVLRSAVESYRTTILLTHVPPFLAAAVYRGLPSGDDYLPYFCCHAVGEMIRGIMETRPDRSLTVLCGHTHGDGECRILPNLEVRTGGSRYGRPRIQDVLVCR